jgi:hypothetical protein
LTTPSIYSKPFDFSDNFLDNNGSINAEFVFDNMFTTGIVMNAFEIHVFNPEGENNG